jgi:hypothetical protein
MNEISMMTGSKVRLTIDHNNIGIKMKDIERQIKQKTNHLLICFRSRDMNFQRCEFLSLQVICDF